MDQNFSQKKVDVQIGKNGLSESMITYMKERFKHVEVLKVRVLKGIVVDKNSVKDLASEAAKKLNAKVLDVRGNTFVLSRS